MTSMILSVAMANAFAFEGGDLALLSKRIYQARTETVAIFVPDEARVGKFTFNWDEPKDFNRHLRRVTGCSSDPLETAYFAAGWPKYLTVVSSRPEGESPKGLEISEWAIEEGVFTKEAESGGYYRLSELATADTKVPIRIHWFLEKGVVAVAAKGSLVDALPTIAKAVGAKVVKRKDTTLGLEPDVESYRSRMIAALRRESEGLAREASEGRIVMREGKRTRVPASIEPVRIATIEMAIAAWEAAPASRIGAALNTRQAVEVDVPRVGVLAGTVARRLDAYAERGDFIVQSGQIPPHRLVDMLDTSRGLVVSLSPQDGHGQVGGYVKGRDDHRVQF